MNNNKPEYFPLTICFQTSFSYLKFDTASFPGLLTVAKKFKIPQQRAYEVLDGIKVIDGCKDGFSLFFFFSAIPTMIEQDLTFVDSRLLLLLVQFSNDCRK